MTRFYAPFLVAAVLSIAFVDTHTDEAPFILGILLILSGALGLAFPRQFAITWLVTGCVLFFTDGMVEGRSPSGDSFGVERLADIWEQQSASGQPPEEILRRLLISVVDYNGGKLRDDATLLQICWNGPQGSRLHH